MSLTARKEVKGQYHVLSDELQVILAKLIREKRSFWCELAIINKKIYVDFVHYDAVYRWVKSDGRNKPFSSIEALEKGLLRVLPYSDCLNQLDIRLQFNEC